MICLYTLINNMIPIHRIKSSFSPSLQKLFVEFGRLKQPSQILNSESLLNFFALQKQVNGLNV